MLRNLHFQFALLTLNNFYWWVLVALQAHGGQLSELTHRMARLGASGKFPNNVERDLANLLQIPIQPYWIQIPVKDPSTRKEVTSMRCPILLPHEVYHYLYEPSLGLMHSFCSCFFVLLPPKGCYCFGFVTQKICYCLLGLCSKASGKLRIDQAKINEFWNNANDPTHPGSQRLTNVVGVYGDDCRYNGAGEKLIAISLNCILFEAARF